LPQRPVTSEDQRLWKEFDLRGTNGNTRRGLEAHHRRVDFPEGFPLFQDLEVDAAGNVWVLRYEPPWSEAPYHWDVFDPEGKRLAEASVPFGLLGPSFRTRTESMFGPLKEIGENYLLLVKKNELGVEQVMKYGLLKGSSHDPMSDRTMDEDPYLDGRSELASPRHAHVW
jgi:hypothetical protein